MSLHQKPYNKIIQRKVRLSALIVPQSAVDVKRFFSLVPARKPDTITAGFVQPMQRMYAGGGVAIDEGQKVPTDKSKKCTL